MKSTPFALATLSVAAIGLVLTGATAHAKDVTVTYHDLDLNTAAGQKSLEKRLDRAAREACGYDEIPTGSRLRSSDAVRCYKSVSVQARGHMAKLVDDARLGG
ncbi:hypothetical protein GCM10011371_15060 [Novosphingobium marinum]|uniref:UrcA family protein n=1 Tax=Novosphingobium marinum TaxID=1514948 RepID=A0A7Y9XW90_9SPHN|nr:UrcA family protein [Novosphingobium marinum]NYH95620.1 UrcA family protein [Novosphingobium marinum]GGC28506.1 hypothetical protein GCM10011371_15060 [Novosphingobium marinum]